MNKMRIIHFVFYIIILILINISWQVENERAARILLGVSIELAFIYAAFYGGTMA